MKFLTKKILLKFTNFLKKILEHSVVLFPQKNTILILRTDNIGDYILFRNFLKILRGSPEYANKKLILVGNESWKDLAEYFDKEYIDVFFWVNKKKYYSSKFYRIAILLRLRRLKAYQALNTVHSRDSFIDELIVFSGVRKRITCEGDAVNNRFNTYKLKHFDTIIPSLSNTEFEFYRNKFFFETLANSKIEISKPSFDIKKKATKENQIIIFPSAADTFRRWSDAHFAELIALLHYHNPYFEFLILGSKVDIAIGNSIIAKMDTTLNIKNLCGETTLVQLMGIISESKLLISNETSAVHLAAALDIKTICISNGNHFKRFTPYPPPISNKIVTLFPTEDFYDETQFEDLAIKYQYKSDLDINVIKPQTVLEAAKLALQ